MAFPHENNEKRNVPAGTAASSLGVPESPLPSPQVEDWPGALRVGGEADLAIARAAGRKNSPEESEICKSFQDDLNNIRKDYKSPRGWACTAKSSSEWRYRTAITDRSRHYNANPVLRFALAFHDSFETDQNELWSPACEKYMENPDAYDRLFGEFIPHVLNNRVRGQLKHRNYIEGTNATAAQDWEVYQLRLRERRRQQTSGLSTGLPGLDRLMGGLPKLALLGGKPGVGKTSFALSLALGALRAHADVAVLFYSLDMTKDVIFSRLVCEASGLDYREFLQRYDEPAVKKRLSDVETELASTILPRLRILEREQLGHGKEQVLSALFQHRVELQEKSKATRLLYVIDYFQLVDVAATVAASIEADYQRIALLQEAQAATCTRQHPGGDSIFVLSEVRKGELGRSYLALEDLLGSARLAYSADCVLLLDTDGEANGSVPGTVPLQLTLAKGRDGMTRGTVHLSFDYSCHRFRETSIPQTGAAHSSGGQQQTDSGRMINALAGAKHE